MVVDRPTSDLLENTRTYKLEAMPRNAPPSSLPLSISSPINLDEGYGQPAGSRTASGGRGGPRVQGYNDVSRLSLCFPSSPFSPSLRCLALAGSAGLCFGVGVASSLVLAASSPLVQNTTKRAFRARRPCLSVSVNQHTLIIIPSNLPLIISLVHTIIAYDSCSGRLLLINPYNPPSPAHTHSTTS